MAAIFQTTFSNAFSRKKIYEFWQRQVACLVFIINNMAADEQVMQEARASAAMVLT